jgi:hypothetical protein
LDVRFVTVYFRTPRPACTCSGKVFIFAVLHERRLRISELRQIKRAAVSANHSAPRGIFNGATALYRPRAVGGECQQISATLETEAAIRA